MARWAATAELEFDADMVRMWWGARRPQGDYCLWQMSKTKKQNCPLRTHLGASGLSQQKANSKGCVDAVELARPKTLPFRTLAWDWTDGMCQWLGSGTVHTLPCD